MNFIDNSLGPNRMHSGMKAKHHLFNLTKIYQQIDYNDSLIIQQHVTRGRFYWENGVKDSRVIFSPDPKGRFKVSWMPNKNITNKKYKKHNHYFSIK